MSELLDRSSQHGRFIERTWGQRNVSSAAQPQLSSDDYRPAMKKATILFMGRPLNVEFEEQIEPWLLPVLESLEELADLPANWNSYGAPPIQQESILAALQLLANTMRDHSPVPFIVPTAKGTVLLEWHTKGIDLEIDVLGYHRFHVVAEDSKRNEEIEEDLDTDLSLMTDFIERLS